MTGDNASTTQCRLTNIKPAAGNGIPLLELLVNEVLQISKDYRLLLMI